MNRRTFLGRGLKAAAGLALFPLLVLPDADTAPVPIIGEFDLMPEGRFDTTDGRKCYRDGWRLWIDRQEYIRNPAYMMRAGEDGVVATNFDAITMTQTIYLDSREVAHRCQTAIDAGYAEVQV